LDHCFVTTEVANFIKGYLDEKVHCGTFYTKRLLLDSKKSTEGQKKMERIFKKLWKGSTTDCISFCCKLII
ncbi:MAG: hypothetical protein ACREOZ_03525, partial [Gloeomargaritales cyanobacterium]